MNFLAFHGHSFAMVRHEAARERRSLTKTLLIMKMTALILLVGSLHVGATGFSQKINLSVRHERIEEVFIQIKNQTGYTFFYNSEWLKNIRDLNLDLKDASIEQAMEQCLKGQLLTFSIVDRIIVLKQKDLLPEKIIAEAPVPVPIRGRVVEQETGKPIAGASIVIKGKKTGTSTNEDGYFTLDVPAGRTIIIISSVGFGTLEQSVSGSESNLQIALAPQKKEMGEVVVTALGIQRTSRSLAYSTQKVSGDQVNEVRDANFTNTLSGKVAGLTVTPSATGPGGATRIVLRGNRSIQGVNNALIVVDGVAVDNSSLPGQQGSDFGGQNGSDGAANINPDDIESISVLKGAAGASLYGSRAANGVIMITTKKGRNSKMALNVNSGATMENPMILPKLQNRYSQGSAGAFAASSPSSWGAEIAGQPVTDWMGNSTTLKAYKDNIKDFFRTGMNLTSAVSVSGGSDKMQTFFSYGNTYTNGIVPKNYLSRHSFNLRMSANISERLSADLKVTYTQQNIYDKPAVGGQGAIVANLYRIPRSVNLDDVKTYKKVSSTGIETPTYWASGESTDMNPYWTAYNTHHNEDRGRITGLVSLKYKITDWLNLQGRISSDSYNDFITQAYAHNTLVFAPISGGFYSEETDFVAERNVDFLLNGNNKLGKDLKISYNLGGSNLSRQSRRRVNTANGLGIRNRFDLSFGTNLLATTAAVRRQLQALYATTQLSYKDYLYLDLTARNDWSSTLPEPYNYFYPSAGLTAIVSDMVAMPSWISLGKVRGSFAKVGNDAAPYLLMQNYSYVAGSYGGYLQNGITKSIGDLKPELTTSLELGTEWRFWNGRLGLDLTYYRTNSKNQLLQVSSPPSSGFTSQYINAGGIRNTGVEVMLTGKAVERKDFEWNVGVNFAKNSNRVESLYPGVSMIYLGGTTVRTSTPVVTAGGSYGDLYGYKWQRLNGQYVVGSNGKPVSTTNIEKVGNFNPDFTLGLSNSWRYKNWSLSALVDGRFGGVITSGTAAQFAFFGDADYTTAYRGSNWILSGVQADGSKNTTSITPESFWTTVSQGNYSWAEFFTYDATNVRLRELTLGYEFKKLPVGFVKSAKLSFVGRNLFFFYLGSRKMNIPGIGKQKLDFDPEVSLSAGNYQGVEYNNLPSTRSMGVNLKVSF
jgi:TonB-linked SusC/RagA family outer membrane protein